MWDNVIGDQIRRANRNLLVINLVVVFAVIGWFALSFRSLYNQVVGPQVTDDQALVSITEPQKLQRYYFKINETHLSPVLYRDLWITYDRTTNQEKTREVRAAYQLMILKGGLILVKSSRDMPIGAVKGLTGVLVPLPAEMKEHIQSIGAGMVNSLLEPTMFDTTRFQDGGGLLPLLAIVPGLAVALWNLKKVMARREDFLQHPLCQRLKKYGDPRELAGLIGQEARDATSVFNVGGLTITKNWILSRHPMGMEVRKADDLVWAHREEISQSVYFVPVGKTQNMHVYFNDKARFCVSPSRADCDKILAALMERAPAALYGYDAGLAGQWAKAPDVVIAQVQKNKADLKEQAKAKSKEKDGDSSS